MEKIHREIHGRRTWQLPTDNSGKLSSANKSETSARISGTPVKQAIRLSDYVGA